MGIIINCCSPKGLDGISFNAYRQGRCFVGEILLLKKAEVANKKTDDQKEKLSTKLVGLPTDAQSANLIRSQPHLGRL